MVLPAFFDEWTLFFVSENLRNSRTLKLKFK